MRPAAARTDASARRATLRALLAVSCALLNLWSVGGCGRNEHQRADQTAAVAVSALAAPTPQTLEPCRLLTADEASVVLGGSAVATPSDAVAYASSCIWEARDPLRGLQVMTSMPTQLHADEALRKIGGDTVEKRYTQLVQTLLLDGKGTPVSGLGDDALWIDTSQQLWIMKKSRALITISFHAEQPMLGAFEKSRAVGEKILARL